MTQRRMPSGQGPARGGRPAAASGPRAASQRFRGRRSADRTPRSDPAARPSTVARPTDVRSGHADTWAGRDANNRDTNNRDPNNRHANSRDRNNRDANSRDARRGIRRAAGPARRTRAPRRPRRISGRAAVLGALLIALAFAYAYPVRVYLEQQAQINALKTSQQQQRQRIQALTDSLAKWNDDDYVIAQAHTRFQLVRKGELLYMVVDPVASQSGTPDRRSAWLDKLWSNLHEIDDPSTP